MDTSISQSILSTANSDQPFQMITRVLSNVVDMQQNMISNFSNLATQIESLRVEVRSSLNALSTKIEDRSDKHISDMRECHDKEVDRMMRLLENMSIKSVQTSSNVQSQPSASQQASVVQQSQLGMMQQAQAQAYAGMMHAMNAQYARMSAMMPQPLTVPGVPIQAPVSVAPLSSGVSLAPATPSTPVIAPPVIPTSAAKPVISFGTPISVSNAQSTLPASSVAKTPVSAATATPAATNATAPKSAVSSPFSQGYFANPTETSTVSIPKNEPSSTPAKPIQHEDEDHEEPEAYEPTDDFKPVIPLPELVDVVTGEENETVVFESRCKVYRFVGETKEWKERGVGQIKVLKNPENEKCRIVMRREQVHKVCVNHYIDAQMKIQSMKNKPKALMWMCMDSSDGEPEYTQLSARFATEELANEFKKVFEECVTRSPGTNSTTKDVPKTKKESPKEEIVIPKNEPENNTTVKTEDKKGFDWKVAEGSWNCDACYANNDASTTKCLCCGTGKDGSAPAAETTLKGATNFATSATAPSGTGFSFGFGSSKTTVGTTPSTTAATSTPKFSFGQAAPADDVKPATPLVPKFSFGKPAEPAATNAAPKTSFAAAAAQAAKDETAKVALPTFSFGNKPTAAASPATGSSAAPTATASASPSISFSFKGANSPKPGTTLFGGSSPSVFGGKLGAASASAASSLADSTSEKEKPDEKPAEPAKVFGSSSLFGSSGGAPSFSFGSPKGNIFDGSAADKAKEQFSALKKAQPLTAKVVEKKNDEDEGGADEEYEPDVDFAPVVPLPDLVEVLTGEENEEVVFAERCKLYRFDRELKETKERGLGDIKILKNSEGQFRVVMRREQVHKLCANFRLTKEMSINVKNGNPLVYSFWCSDCSEVPSGVTETFFAKFKTEDSAKRFAEKFEEGCAAGRC